ncbi:hypothetical protein [Pseudotabrizicola formosa]|uniref:hypothetical protein n=1 Tax=Pseudotabrizicola formosa TaxID=2030009 RepID=UPI000CD20791|nr:hypothetical protein [Pseudotabrizicola formosa]
MALAYDFDIFRIVPDFGPSDPALAGLLKDVGVAGPQDAATVALFRDPRTAAALRRAPSGLRSYLLDSGFGLNTYSSGAPAGRYPPGDEAARLDLIQRLAENAPRFALPRPEDCAEGGDVFRLGAFLEALEAARPDDSAAAGTPVRNPNPDQSAGRVLPRRGSAPPRFETQPLSDAPPPAAQSPARLNFWQSRYFRIAAAAVLMLGAMQMVSGPALSVIASL